MNKKIIIDTYKDGDNEELYNVKNLTWEEYCEIMISLKTIIDIFENSMFQHPNDNYIKRLFFKYKTLFIYLESRDVPWRGKAVSIEDEIIRKAIQEY